MCCIGLFFLKSNSPPTYEMSVKRLQAAGGFGKWKTQWEGVSKGDPRRMMQRQDEQETAAAGDASNVALQ